MVELDRRALGQAEGQVSGLPFDAKTPNIIAAGQTLRMLRDNILLEPLDWHPSHVIELVRFGRPLRGIVKAIGPGCYKKVWTYITTPDGNRQRSSYKDTMIFQPTDVRVGDVVELGGKEAFDGEGYKFEDLMIDGKTHLLVTEKDVCGIV